MKNFTLFTSFLFLLTGLSLSAQVVITADDFNRPAGLTDTMHFYALQPGTSIQAGADMTWDLSDAAFNTIQITVYQDASGNTYFPDALNYWSTPFSFQGLPIETYTYEVVDGSGWYIAGRRSVAVSHSIAAISGGANDLLVFPNQVKPFEGNIDLIKFPLQFEDSWTEMEMEAMDFELTVAAFGLSSVPGSRNIYRTETRTVSGYGHLLLPAIDGETPEPLEVLMMEITADYIDSIFLNGMPGPPALMSAFGLTQGATSSSSRINFYSKGNYAPLATVHANGTFLYRPSAVQLETSIKPAALAKPMLVYPNPTQRGGKIAIELPDAIHHGSLEIINIAGMTVYIANLDAHAGEITVYLPELPAGLYSIAARENTGSIIGIQKLIIQ